MGMFTMRKPRSYHHEYIYVDERKEKLQKIEETAKRELGMLPPKEFSPAFFDNAGQQIAAGLGSDDDGAGLEF